MRSSNLAYAIRQQEMTEEQKVHIRQVRPSRAMKQKHRVHRTLLMVGYVVLLSAALIYGKVKLTEENASLMNATQSYQELQSEYAQLEAAASTMVSLKSVEEQARAMGLSEIKSNQVENIVVADNNKVEVSENKNSFQSWWDDLMEYILG